VFHNSVPIADRWLCQIFVSWCFGFQNNISWLIHSVLCSCLAHGFKMWMLCCKTYSFGASLIHWESSDWCDRCKICLLAWHWLVIIDSIIFEAMFPLLIRSTRPSQSPKFSHEARPIKIHATCSRPSLFVYGRVTIWYWSCRGRVDRVRIGKKLSSRPH